MPETVTTESAPPFSDNKSCTSAPFCIPREDKGLPGQLFYREYEPLLFCGDARSPLDGVAECRHDCRS